MVRSYINHPSIRWLGNSIRSALGSSPLKWAIYGEEIHAPNKTNRSLLTNHSTYTQSSNGSVLSPYIPIDIPFYIPFYIGYMMENVQHFLYPPSSNCSFSWDFPIDIPFLRKIMAIFGQKKILQKKNSLQQLAPATGKASGPEFVEVLALAVVVLAVVLLVPAGRATLLAAAATEGRGGLPRADVEAIPGPKLQTPTANGHAGPQRLRVGGLIL